MSNRQFPMNKGFLGPNFVSIPCQTQGMDSLVIIITAVATAVVTAIVVSLVIRKAVSTSPSLTPEQLNQQVSAATNAAFIEAQRRLEESNEMRLRATTEGVETQNRQASTTMKEVVDPLKASLLTMQEKINELEKSRVEAYTKIDGQVNNTQDLLKVLQSETNSLSSALRRNDTRGKWGELQLRRVLEMMQLREHHEFVEQKQEGGEGSGIPDFTIFLPGNRVLYIDSKVPLNSYLDALSTDSPDEQKPLLEAHAKAMKDHIAALVKRNYTKDPKSLPYVVLFVPTESSLAAACDVNPKLLEEAAEKGIIITSPTALIAVLTNISLLWQNARQAENVAKINETSTEFLKRLEKFIGDFSKVGTSLKKSVDEYNSAVGSFDSRLMPQARKLNDLGHFNEKLTELNPVEEQPRQSRYESDSIFDDSDEQTA